MPSIAAHLVVAKLVSDKIKINKKEFYKGCVLPDIINNSDSHYKIKGKYYFVPDIEKYKQSVDLSLDINKGYLCHLLLDKYFLDEFIIDNIVDYDKVQLFSSNLMYNDYTNMNYLLVKKYNLDLNYINDILSKYKEDLDIKKYKLNLQWINKKEIGELKVIDFNKFCSFLEDISNRIVNEIKR